MFLGKKIKVIYFFSEGDNLIDPEQSILLGNLPTLYEEGDLHVSLWREDKQTFLFQLAARDITDSTKIPSNPRMANMQLQGVFKPIVNPRIFEWLNNDDQRPFFDIRIAPPLINFD